MACYSEPTANDLDLGDTDPADLIPPTPDFLDLGSDGFNGPEQLRSGLRHANVRDVR